MLLDDKLFLTALSMLGQCAIDKAMRVRRVTAAQDAAWIDPPQSADLHDHRDDLACLLT